MVFEARAAFTPYTGYIDNIEEDDTPVSVFKTPGQNWNFCKKDPVTKACADAVGWPSRDAKIKVLSPPVKQKARDAVTGESYEEEYLEIEFTYDRKGADGKVYHQHGTGYIESSYISKKKTKSFYTAQNSDKPFCPPGQTNDPQNKIKKDVAQFKDLAASTENLSLEKKADLLSKTVGFCPLKPPTKKPSGFEKNRNVYDQKILPTLLSAKLPNIKNEANKPISRDELIQIDALARTLYGEMAICYRRGLQYPMAVARIIVNRANEESREGEFIKPPHSNRTPALVQVCTTPSQFSMWLGKIKGTANEPLHHGMCPPTELNGPFWKSSQAPANEYDIWKNTLRIATEAILYPKQFKKRTNQIDGFFYTSGVGKFYNMKKEVPSIEGKPIDRAACLEIWKE